MKENIKRDYLKYLLTRTQTNLTRYQISNPDTELIRNIFHRLSFSENLQTELYILYNIKEFKSLSKYFIYIFKKIEDDVISFDNLLQNLHNDSEYIENEILIYLSNPTRKEISEFKFPEEKNDAVKHLHKKKETEAGEKDDSEDTDSTGEGQDDELETDVIKFRENYLELIQSDEGDQDVVFELPVQTIETVDPGSAFELPSADTSDKEETESKVEEDIITEENIVSKAQDEDAGNEMEIKEKIIFKKEKLFFGNFESESDKETKPEESENKEEDRIQLSEEIQEELNLFQESDEIAEDEEEDAGTGESEPRQANVLFLEYENEIKEKNKYLESEFDQMISLINIKGDSNDIRSKTIANIIETGNYLESASRNMSLEIISNIYQTVTLSFEKIAESKYDLSESTLNLFKKGLSLILSLIKGDDYYGYKDILKSIENIRNALIEEKQKRETYLKRLQEKLDLENDLNRKYPNDIQKEKISYLKQLIKDTEHNFKSLEKIQGEYQIYEALRSLSGSLNNFKDIVKLSKELQMKKLVQLAEAGYIFVKFLQNYRINPVTIETTEIFGYIIYNLKALVVEKPVEDIDLFISYLNDPVKIYSKSEKKKT